MNRKADLKPYVGATRCSGTVRGFSLVELMVVVAVLSILASTALGAFQAYVARSKASEAVTSLAKIVQGEIEYFQKNSTYLDAGPTNIPPSSSKVVGDFEASPNWKLINFGIVDPILYGYQAILNSPTEVDCEAVGDLDGDGITSSYLRTLSIAASGQPAVGGLQTFDELE